MARLRRPQVYDPEIAKQLLAVIATCTKGLPKICAANKGFPTPTTMYRWMLEEPSFRESYARAKADQTQVLEDEMIVIADTPKMGEVVTRRPGKGRNVEIERKAGDMIEHRRLQIETRKWLMGKLRPKKYGDRVAIGGGADGKGPIPVEHSVNVESLIDRIVGSREPAKGPDAG